MKFETAKADFDLAIKHQGQNNFENFKHRVNMGITLRRLGDLEESII